jgi:hypothetical protein
MTMAALDSVPLYVGDGQNGAAEEALAAVDANCLVVARA